MYIPLILFLLKGIQSSKVSNKPTKNHLYPSKNTIQLTVKYKINHIAINQIEIYKLFPIKRG